RGLVVEGKAFSAASMSCRAHSGDHVRSETSMTPGKIPILGGVIFWSIGEWSQRSVIKAGFENLGLEKFVPEPRAPAVALKDALESVFSDRNCDVVRLKNSDAFEVVRLVRQEYPRPNQRTVEQVVRIDEKTLRIAFSPMTDKAQAVVDAFNRHLGLL